MRFYKMNVCMYEFIKCLLKPSALDKLNLNLCTLGSELNSAIFLHIPHNVDCFRAIRKRIILQGNPCKWLLILVQFGALDWTAASVLWEILQAYNTYHKGRRLRGSIGKPKHSESKVETFSTKCCKYPWMTPETCGRCFGLSHYYSYYFLPLCRFLDTYGWFECKLFSCHVTTHFSNTFRSLLIRKQK